MKKLSRAYVRSLGLEPGDQVHVISGGIGSTAVVAGVRGELYELDIPVQSPPGSRPGYLRKPVCPEELESMDVLERGFEPHRRECPMVEVCSGRERYLGYASGEKDGLLLVSVPGEQDAREVDLSDRSNYVYPVGRKGPFLEPE